MSCHLAVDIGASSGRLIVGLYNNGKLELEEVYRFKNQLVSTDGRSCWDLNGLFNQILEGMRQCKAAGYLPETIGIDTWGCDYVLLDQDQTPIGHPIAYRDDRHEQSAASFLNKYSSENLYAINGLQYQPFNTLFQLYQDERLEQAENFLMVPDYLNFLLSGKTCNEYTNLSTSGLLDCKTRKPSVELLEAAGIAANLLCPVTPVGEGIGTLRPEIAQSVGFDCRVIAVPSHDTASAYLASPCKDQIILSSGTWSLLGAILDEPIVEETARAVNFTNEGCANGQIRLLKNVMGLWIIQEVARNLDYQYSFAKLVELARNDPYEEIFDVNKACFLHPDNMIETIQEDYRLRGIEPPHTPGQIADAVYRSLAYAYQQAVLQLEDLTHKTYSAINIIGGGCQNGYLNELIAKETGKTVLAGPVEATAIGNLLSQINAANDTTLCQSILENSFQSTAY